MSDRRLAGLGVTLVAAGLLVMTVASLLGSGSASRSGMPLGMGSGMMGQGPGTLDAAPGPGQPGFVAGTASAPRLVRIVGNDALRFQPEVVLVERGETIRFEVTTMGRTGHEFMVGPAEDVATHREGTPEIPDLGMMETGTVTYTFEGSGPFAFACHFPGHYEAGMRGEVVVLP